MWKLCLLSVFFVAANCWDNPSLPALAAAPASTFHVVGEIDELGGQSWPDLGGSSWTTPAKAVMLKAESNKMSLTVNIAPGSYKYKIVWSEWQLSKSTYFGCGATLDDNCVLNVSLPSDVTFNWVQDSAATNLSISTAYTVSVTAVNTSATIVAAPRGTVCVLGSMLSLADGWKTSTCDDSTAQMTWVTGTTKYYKDFAEKQDWEYKLYYVRFGEPHWLPSNNMKGAMLPTGAKFLRITVDFSDASIRSETHGFFTGTCECEKFFVPPTVPCAFDECENGAQACQAECAIPKTADVPLIKIPAYSGAAVITGSAFMTFVKDTVIIDYNLAGVEATCATPNASAANSCGIHIHSGTSCTNSSSQGGHYYSPADQTDPWKQTYYIANDTVASGTVYVTYGAMSGETLGRVMIVHDYTGARVTCSVIAGRAQTAKELAFAQNITFAPYPSSPSAVTISGSASLNFQAYKTSIRFELTSKGENLTNNCLNGPGPANNSCGIHIHTNSTSSLTCANAASIGGHYYSSKFTSTTDPWKRATYRSTSCTADLCVSSKGLLVVDSGFTYPDLMGKIVVVHDYNGARVICNQFGATCSDMVQNQRETGVDFGGECTASLTTASPSTAVIASPSTHTRPSPSPPSGGPTQKTNKVGSAGSLAPSVLLAVGLGGVLASM